MAGWILVVGAASPGNWALGRGAGIWATKRSRDFKEGDRLFFWQAGAGLIANAVALSDAMTSRDYDYDALPWPDRWGFKQPRPENELYRSIVEMRVLQETEPLAMTWTQIANALSFSGGANTAPVQFGDPAADRAVTWFGLDVATPPVAVEFDHLRPRVRRSEADHDADEPADDTVVAVQSPPRTIDPDVVGEARNRHNATVRAIHAFLRSRGRRPIKPTGWFGEQPDVVWREGSDLHIVEVKGLSDQNERQQLRLGLGQILRYRFISQEQGYRPQAWLVTDTAPADFLWNRICESVGVRLWWLSSTAPGPGEAARSARQI